MYLIPCDREPPTRVGRYNLVHAGRSKQRIRTFVPGKHNLYGKCCAYNNDSVCQQIAHLLIMFAFKIQRCPLVCVARCAIRLRAGVSNLYLHDDGNDLIISILKYKLCYFTGKYKPVNELRFNGYTVNSCDVFFVI